MLLALPLAAQEDDADLRRRMARLESELTNLRERLERQERTATDEELRSATLVQVYGDIGLRYHMLFESQTETFNRPEYRVGIGIFGTAFEQDQQRIRYDARIGAQVLDDIGRPVPTVTWVPLPGFGARPGIAFERFLIEFDFDRTLQATLGRFPTPFTGTEMLFDQDLHFQGVTQSVRFDRFLSDSGRRYLPRIEVVGVQSYLAENRLGLPTPTETRPLHVGAQFRLDLAPMEQSPESIRASPDWQEGRAVPEVSGLLEWRFVAGVHWFDGEEQIAENLGVGYLDSTTNVLDPDGRVRSDFLLGEVYTELIFLRAQRARVVAWFHGIFNFHARSRTEEGGRKQQHAMHTGVSWGMERLRERWDFRVAFQYFYIEADALIPEFNSEVLNTNIKGWEVSLSVRAWPTVTVFGMYSITERKDYELNGFGRPSAANPDHSGGQSMRIRVGLHLEF